MQFAHKKSFKNERNIICIVMRNIKLITHDDFKKIHKYCSFFVNMKIAMDKTLSLVYFTGIVNVLACMPCIA